MRGGRHEHPQPNSERRLLPDTRSVNKIVLWPIYYLFTCFQKGLLKVNEFLSVGPRYYDIGLLIPFLAYRIPFRFKYLVLTGPLGIRPRRSKMS
jgi:hypothetical protein